ncbi:NAD(P)/FAD-dependent oxidoreductase [Granulicella mallensis]|uniref:Diapolycopene oxygenase n=1 Tax=Granulicella mallensis TaxID=940614 RepID=A0A7W7ZPB5_9BACT|nr:phytoene desaturase family protein [Granulicella mallensis]MBB5063284.1 diapolycopene oxygenase [Granulicella mallensis]
MSTPATRTGNARRVVVIGAGLGGMTTAIQLAREGFQVDLLEKNGCVGGKLNLRREAGFSFDLGPSIFTLPQIFRPVFEGDGKRLEDYITLQRVDPQWRNFFEDGKIIDLWEDPAKMSEELSALGGDAVLDYKRFLEYSRKQYEIVERGYFERGLDTFWQFVRFYGLRGARDLDYTGTMAGGIAKRVRDPYLRDILEYFIKYVGSSAYDAPGFMNLMPNIQLEFGLWYVSGGLYELARAFEKRLEETGVRLHLKHRVSDIDKEGDRVTGVQGISDQGETFSFAADFVVSNMEVLPANQQLLKEPERVMKKLARFEPACSGIVLHLGLDRTYPQLAHHNFFFSGDQKAHFHRVFREKLLPDDPTIYLVAPTRTDPSQAPPGCDNIKILPHIPYLNDQHPYTREDCVALKERCLDKLERMGLTDLRKHIVVEDFWTPFDIEERYLSNRGSIYGVVSDRRRNFAFKAPKRSPRYKNLFFVGGSVNPGGGMPMVTLCGQHVAKLILEQSEES